MFKNGTGLENVAARMFKMNQVDNLYRRFGSEMCKKVVTKIYLLS